jgi:hypothetical protein
MRNLPQVNGTTGVPLPFITALGCEIGFGGAMDSDGKLNAILQVQPFSERQFHTGSFEVNGQTVRRQGDG